MARPPLPTVEQVLQLPALLTREIPPEWEDRNGHVNVQFYMELYSEAGWPMLEAVGVDRDYFERRRQGFFDLEHHLLYLEELHVSDTVSVHSRVLAVTPKRFHGMLFCLNRSRERLAGTMEYVTSGADLDQRRTAPFPKDVATRLQELVEAQRELDWPPPACGVISA